MVLQAKSIFRPLEIALKKRNMEGIAGSFGLEVLEHSYCLANFYEDAKYASATSVFSTYINSHILLYALREMNVFSFKCAHFYQEYSNF